METSTVLVEFGYGPSLACRFSQSGAGLDHGVETVFGKSSSEIFNETPAEIGPEVDVGGQNLDT